MPLLDEYMFDHPVEDNNSPETDKDLVRVRLPDKDKILLAIDLLQEVLDGNENIRYHTVYSSDEIKEWDTDLTLADFVVDIKEALRQYESDGYA